MSAWRVFATRKTGIFRDLVLSRALRAYIDANGLDACRKQRLHGRLHDPHVNNRTKSAG
jgi:hypothetical protein